MSVPLVTVVIPTKNRPQTAVATIVEAAKVAPGTELEIIVHDCSDTPKVRELLAQHGLLERVRYHYVELALSMTENWNLAMQYATGEWVTIIGDDDAIAPGIVDIARWASGQGFRAVKSKQYSFYGHPDLPDDASAGRLRIAPFTGSVSVTEVAPLLERATRTGDLYAQLPMVYHNLVRRTLLETIHEKAGHFFDGLAPDIYSAFAISALIDQFAVVDYPLTIVGASGMSNSARSKTGEGHLHAAEYRAFEYTWMTPNSWILPASVPDNVVRALTDVGRTDLLARMDVTRIFARTIRSEPSRVMEHLSKYVCARRRQKRSVIAGVALVSLAVLAKSVVDFGRHVRGSRTQATGTWFDDIRTIEAAIVRQSEWLRENDVRCPGSDSSVQSR